MGEECRGRGRTRGSPGISNAKMLGGTMGVTYRRRRRRSRWDASPAITGVIPMDKSEHGGSEKGEIEADTTPENGSSHSLEIDTWMECRPLGRELFPLSDLAFLSSVSLPLFPSPYLVSLLACTRTIILGYH